MVARLSFGVVLLDVLPGVSGLDLKMEHVFSMWFKHDARVLLR